MELLYAAHVPAGEGPFPTVIALHGWGASAHDLMGLAPMLLGGRALVLCPQGTVELNVGGGMKGYGWFPLVPGGAVDPVAFVQAAQRLHAFVAGARERYPIGKIVPVGFSQGGLMAYELGLKDPAGYVGIGGLSTWFPAPLAEQLPKLPSHEGLPVLVVHGTRDPMIEIERARESREALRGYGVALTYREFEMAHEIRPEALRLINTWLEEKAFAERPA